MLTREKFMDAWARPKEDVTPSAMVVDKPTKNSTDALMEEVIESVAKDVAMEDDTRSTMKHVGGRSFKPMKMPTFAFQRQGIGLKKRHKTKPKLGVSGI